MSCSWEIINFNWLFWLRSRQFLQCVSIPMGFWSVNYSFLGFHKDFWSQPSSSLMNKTNKMAAIFASSPVFLTFHFYHYLWREKHTNFLLKSEGHWILFADKVCCWLLLRLKYNLTLLWILLTLISDVDSSPVLTCWQSLVRWKCDRFSTLEQIAPHIHLSKFCSLGYRVSFAINYFV